MGTSAGPLQGCKTKPARRTDRERVRKTSSMLPRYEPSQGDACTAIHCVADERLCVTGAALAAAKQAHPLVIRVELRRTLARVGEAGFALQGLRRRDVHVIRRMEVLRLRAREHLEVIEKE